MALGHRRAKLVKMEPARIGGVEPEAPALAQWKRERLAHHHAYFAMLDRSFARWKKATLVRRQRRQRVIAACCVGARFFQRLYWAQWLALVAYKQATRAQASQRLRSLCSKAKLRKYFENWKQPRTTTDRKRHLPAVSVHPADEKFSERSLVVRGFALPATVTTSPKTTIPAPIPSDHGDVKHIMLSARTASLARIVVQRTQKQYFHVWRRVAHVVEKLITDQLNAKADFFRLSSSWRRWCRGLSVRTKNHSASRQAVFFLYYHLTKKSIVQLSKFVSRQRQERRISIVVASRVRRRSMSAAFLMWRQRLDAKLVFSQWRDLVTDGSCHHHNAQLEVVRDVVKSLEERHLLHRFFNTWFEKLTVRTRSQAIERLLKAPVSMIAVKQAFQQWSTWSATRKQEATLVESRNRENLQRVWRAWSDYTKAKELGESLRRTATRYWYYRKLRQAFQAFKLVRTRRYEVEQSILSCEQRRTSKLTRRCLHSWVAWASSRSRRREKLTLAYEHYRLVLKRTVFHGLVTLHRQAQERDTVVRHRRLERSHRALRDAFELWKLFCAQERDRNYVLSSRFERYRVTQALKVKRQFFRALVKNATVRIARRLQNAYVRGHYQGQLLRLSYSRWVCSVAQLKWDHAFAHRAQQFCALRLKRRCLQVWKERAKAIRKHRDMNRRALHHWKMFREREAFSAWIRYIKEKCHQRERVHSALEFRHRTHIVDGLNRWVTGGTFLFQQRSKRTVETQATQTAQIWHTVRKFASHWLWITQQKKHAAALGLTREERHHHHIGSAPSHVNDDVDYGRINTSHLRLKQPPPKASQPHTQLTPLSEFVMLPRNRPRPRKPVEIIIDGASEDIIDDCSQDNDTSVLRRVGNRYGLYFPVEPVTFACSRLNFGDANAHTQASPELNVDKVGCTAATTSRYCIDQLEDQLLRWHAHRERLNHLQQSLEDFRTLLHQASLEGNLSQQELTIMRARLRAMEQQEEISRKRWLQSRPDIMSLAHRIQELRNGTAMPV